MQVHDDRGQGKVAEHVDDGPPAQEARDFGTASGEGCGIGGEDADVEIVEGKEHHARDDLKCDHRHRHQRDDWLPLSEHAHFLQRLRAIPGARAVRLTTRPGTPQARAVDTSGHGGDQARWWQRPEVLDAVVPVVIARVGLLVVGALAGGLLGSPPDAAPADLPEWLRVWDRWDGPHYLRIAAHGYDPTGDPALAAFLPLYPALIRLGSFVVPPLVAAMLISFVATVAASLALYALVLRDGGDRAMARRAVIALNVFPSAFALVAPYAEALFLALSIGALLAARIDRWAQAGFLGLLSGLARLQGWLLGPVLLVDRFDHHRLGRSMLWALAVALAPLLFLGLNALAYGDPLFFLGQQAGHFGHSLAAPWQVIGDLLGGVARHDDPLWPSLYLAPVVAYVVLGAVAVWSIRSRSSRPAYATYVLLALVVLASVTWPISAPRYVGAIFPVFVALADVGRHRRLWLAWVTISTVMLVGITAIFVAGGWVF
jgi:hypothetical protein